MASNNIVLIHGLWMTPLSFEFWAHHYTERGYSVHRAATGRGFRVIKVRRHGTPPTEAIDLP